MMKKRLLSAVIFHRAGFCLSVGTSLDGRAVFLSRYGAEDPSDGSFLQIVGTRQANGRLCHARRGGSVYARAPRRSHTRGQSGGGFYLRRKDTAPVRRTFALQTKYFTGDAARLRAGISRSFCIHANRILPFRQYCGYGNT